MHVKPYESACIWYVEFLVLMVKIFCLFVATIGMILPFELMLTRCMAPKQPPAATERHLGQAGKTLPVAL